MVLMMAFRNGLVDAIQDPNVILMKTDKFAVIKDKYPKSKFHFLVLPYDPVDTVFDLSSSGVELIQEMELMGKRIIEAYGLRPEMFRMGFHAVPSHIRAHLHVLSQDFISDTLSNVWEYNSFNTDFFWPPSKIIKDLQTLGSVPKLPMQEAVNLLNTPLKCNSCSFTTGGFGGFNKLKKHLLTHAEMYS